MAEAFLPTVYRVTDRHTENAETVTFAAEPLEGPRLAFAPGQFTMLYLFGKGEIPISISGDPRGSAGLVHTVQAVGELSRAFTELAPGDRLGVRGPFGRGWPLEAARGRDVVLMAGGLGLAPLRPVITSLMAERERYGRVVLLYGARSPEHMIFAEELKSWRASFDMEVLVTVDLAGAAWYGHVGVVTGLCRPAAALADFGKATAYVCGPPIMLRFGVRELLGLGIEPERLFLSLERNMKCALGMCGHCQYGPYFLCKDGPVFSQAELAPWDEVREL